MKTKTLVVLAGLLVLQANAQPVLFDFDNAPRYTPLPISLTVAGVTAQFSATGQGFSIQAANTLGFTPVGFSGNCIYPSSINASDLHIAFSQPLTDFAILYSPQELACDASATMRVTAYKDGTLMGTATTNATAKCTCTWVSEWLRFSSSQGFNSVVVHYDAPAPGCQDYGVIFLADNMTITLAPPPILLTGATKPANGAFQFAFTSMPNAPCTVFGTTNPTLPFSNWTALDGLTEAPPGHFQFTDSQATNTPRRFYRVSSP